MTDYVDVKIRVTKEVQEKIEYLGSQCDLTGDQMASAMFVIGFPLIPDGTKEQVAEQPAADEV